MTYYLFYPIMVMLKWALGINRPPTLSEYDKRFLCYGMNEYDRRWLFYGGKFKWEREVKYE